MLRGSRGRGLLETETPGDREPLGTGAERCLRRRPSGTRTRAGGDERRVRHRAVSALVRAQRSGRGGAAPRFALPCPSRRSVARVTWAHLAQVGWGRRRSQLAGNAGTPRVPRSGTGRRGAGGGSCPVLPCLVLPCPALHCSPCSARPGVRPLSPRSRPPPRPRSRIQASSRSGRPHRGLWGIPSGRGGCAGSPDPTLVLSGPSYGQRAALLSGAVLGGGCWWGGGFSRSSVWLGGMGAAVPPVRLSRGCTAVSVSAPAEGGPAANGML